MDAHSALGTVRRIIENNTNSVPSASPLFGANSAKCLLSYGIGGTFFMRTVMILGTEYTITVKKYDEDDVFKRLSVDGYCDGYIKSIVVCDMSTYKGWEHEPKATLEIAQKQTLRHEIVHAFFNESGLASSAFGIDCSWAKNEEMVDWIALQGPKIYMAWQEAGAI